jgi:hypothetical protein
MSDNAYRPPAPSLPATVMDLLAQRKTMRARSLNDDVEDCHLKLYEDQSYRKLFLPIWKEETIEGSFIADDITAAMMIRDFAKKNRLPIASNAKLHAIVRSLFVVCRRYQMDRRTRQAMVGGDTVSVNDEHEHEAETHSARRAA